LELLMAELPPLSREQFIEAMRRRVEETLGRVADAINAAPAGQVIAGSEERVRDLFGELRRAAFEQVVPMRIDAAEAAFPPSAGPDDGALPAQ
jgi:hypothetical protein